MSTPTYDQVRAAALSGTRSVVEHLPLDAIGQQLRAASWQADILGGSANGDGYRGRLQVRKAGA